MNRRAILVQFLLFATSAALAAQNQTGPKFEVASVKPASLEPNGPYAYREDPGHITYGRIVLLNLIQRAYFSRETITGLSTPLISTRYRGLPG